MIFIFSIKHHNDKISSLYQFQNNQDFILKNFSLVEEPKSLEKCITIFFIQYFCVMLASYIGIIICMGTFLPDEKLYCAQYVVLTFVIHAQSFQILAYSKLITFQLKLFNAIDTKQLDKIGQKKFKNTLFSVFEFADKVNRIFSASLLTALFYVYMSLLGNLHWFFMSILSDTHLSCNS